VWHNSSVLFGHVIKKALQHYDNTVKNFLFNVLYMLDKVCGGVEICFCLVKLSWIELFDQDLVTRELHGDKNLSIFVNSVPITTE